MSDIRFYIPEDETIPTDLRLYVDDVYVSYRRENNKFVFLILLDDEEKAMEIANEIVQRMKAEHDESQRGVSWRTVSLKVAPQEDRYKIGTIIEWEYRVRDSY